MSRLLFFLLSFALMMSAQSHAATPNDEANEAAYGRRGEIRRGLPMGGDRQRSYYERIIRSVQPDLVGRPESLNVYTRLFEREMVTDTRTFATSIQAKELDDQSVVLTGHVMFEENKRSLLKLFETLQFKVVDEVEVLPSADLGELSYGLVKAPHVFSYDKPTSPRETLTQAYLGEPIFLLKLAGDGHVLASNAEGYIGYLPLDHIERVTVSDFDAYQSGPRILVQSDVRDGDLFVPLGSRIKAGPQKENFVEGILPDGKTVRIPKDKAVVIADETPAVVEAAIKAAEAKMGTLYVWGGKTSEGVDCSGLVQSSFRTTGLNLPRDTYMQAYAGTLSATRWHKDGLRRGDLLFFLGWNGRINHVAISLGGLRYIEASGTVRIGSLDPNDPDYDERRAKGFAFSKRIIE
ncbi:hypothetical protein GC173_01625 [bacterium]|nr:hypothetical protein [bacterium]